MEPILKVRNLQTGYGDLRVVWDVSFDVYPGQVTALLGRNGAGKTSTLRALSGLNKVASGTVEMDGADITGVPPAHKRVRQGDGVRAGGQAGLPQADRRAEPPAGRVHPQGKARRAYGIRRIDVRDVPDPGGEAFASRRFHVGRSAADARDRRSADGAARLLLLDEPSGGLAPVIVGEVMDRVQQLKETGLAVLLVEQAVEAAMSVADHVTVLDIGKVVLDADARTSTTWQCSRMRISDASERQ